MACRAAPALFGAHRVVNAVAALACLDAPGMPPLSDETARGLVVARWPGCLQRLPCAEGREVWLDGGHNPSANAALAAGRVGAPLDDANVERFCDLLDDIARESRTRFLIVTHHRLTMARMDRLYGVTMAERGVSRLVSVDLAAAAADLAAE